MNKITLSEAKLLNLKQYFTGIPCANGHLASRLVANRSCVECSRIRLSVFRLNNRETLLQKKREYAKKQRQQNPEHIYAIAKRSVLKNAVARNKEKSKWSKRNSARVLAWCRKRQLAKLQRTPAWLTQDDLWMIEQAYELAAIRTKMFGFKWHVDHIVPLQGKYVSGLHTPNNLQVITASENSRKGNRL